MENKKIAIIGCGNLGLSILNGLLAEESIDPTNIIATRRNIESLRAFKDRGVTITNDNVKAIASSQIIIVALKPYVILDLLSQLRGQFDPEKHVIVSLATGISISQIKATVNSDTQIFRAMPNTAADVGESMTCICSNSNDLKAIQIVKNCFNTIGETIMIEENLMDSATVLGACGVAYVLRFIRGMIQIQGVLILVIILF